MSGEFDAKAFAKLEGEFKKQHEALEGFITKANEEIKTAGKESAETRTALDKLGEKLTLLGDQMQELEQRGSSWFEGDKQESIGEQFVKTDQLQALKDGRQATARMEIKAAIINATGQNQPLVPAHRIAGIVHEPMRVLRLRDVLPGGRTASNLIEFAKENVFTNLAGPQIAGSPEAFENVTKPESSITFTLATAAVATIAHFIPASKQILDDAPGLASYIDGRMMYGVKLKEDTELINGTGANGRVAGLANVQTAFVNSASPNYTSKLDILRDSMRQAHVSEYQPDFFILNPLDWSIIELSKDSQGRYIFANPQSAAAPAVWGLPIVLSNSMAAGTFLTVASQSCQIFDREDANVQVSLEDSTNFQKNMVTIRAEERLAFVTYRAQGVVGGSF